MSCSVIEGNLSLFLGICVFNTLQFKLFRQISTIFSKLIFQKIFVLLSKKSSQNMTGD